MAETNGRGTRTKAAGQKAPSAWPAFITAHDALVVRIEERLHRAGLPGLIWYVVLWVLERAPDQRLRMHELADTAVIARSNLTRLVDKMEKEGLVARERVADDRRGAYARITDKGHEMRSRMWTVYGPAIDELFLRHLTPEENSLLREIMMRLLAVARGQERPDKSTRIATGLAKEEKPVAEKLGQAEISKIPNGRFRRP
ncbi:MAG: MarR family transcriptional regulator [Rhodomicrobium sp.]|nr:MarR family transcriptional regulator [Rhodomicrobium sp.]